MGLTFLERLLHPRSGSKKEYQWRLHRAQEDLPSTINQPVGDDGQPHGVLRPKIREILLNQAHIGKAEDKNS